MLTRTIPFLCLLASLSGPAQTHLKIGEPAPEISITHWLRNVPSDTSLEGKYIVLEFWATWCAPCLAAVPHLNELQSRFSRPELLFLSMTYEAPETARKVFNRVDFHSAVVTDEYGQTQIRFGDGVRGLTFYPLTVLIDHKNIIRWYGDPKDLSASMIEDLLLNKNTGAFTAKESPPESVPIQIADFIDRSYFSELFGDPDVTWLVHIRERPEGTEQNAAVVMMPGTCGFAPAISLEELFRRMFPRKRFLLPPSIAGKRFNFAYVNKVPTSDGDNRLQSEILDQLKLDARTSFEQTTDYNISISDPSLLVPDTGPGLSSYKPDDEGYLVFSKYTIQEMVLILTQQTDHNWSFQGKAKDRHAFRIDVASTGSIISSLEQYGFRVKKKAGKLETVYLSERN